MICGRKYSGLRLVRLLSPVLSNSPQWSLLKAQLRCLSYTEATTILRPFFFAVHPDFFYQQPSRRAANEHSLKLLNARLVAFSHGAGASQTKLDDHLTFYMRRTALSATEAAKLGRTAPDVKSVTVRLTQPNLSDLVRHILDVSELPLADYRRLQQRFQAKAPPSQRPRPSIFRHNFYEDLEDGSVSQPPRLTALSWLTEHLPKAIETQASNQPIRDEISALSQEMLDRFRAREIVWDAEWTPASHLACLRSLNKLLSQARAQPLLPVIEGRRISLTNCSGWSIFDDILLSVRDVSEAWLSVLGRRHFESSRVGSRPQLTALERGVSILLCGAQVHRHPFVHECTRITDYYKDVRRLFKSLYHFTLEETPNLPKDLFQHARIAIEDVGGSLSYASDLDIFLIPSGTPAFLIVDYLLQKSSIPTQKVAHEEAVARYALLSQGLIDNLGISGLRRDSNVSLSQGLEALEKLTVLGTSFLPTKDALSGLEVCIGRYYAVSGSGVIYLPWDADWI